MTATATTCTTKWAAAALVALALASSEPAVSGFAPAPAARSSPAFGLRPVRRRSPALALSASSGEDEEKEDPKKLIVGEEAIASELQSLESKLQSVGSEEGYLAAARRRQEEARAKMLAEHEEEMRLAEERDAAAAAGEGGDRPGAANYGPGDLSAAGSILTSDDGWESSLGKDEDNIIGAQAALGEEKEGDDEDEEGPSLFIPGGEDGDGPIVF